MAMQRISSNSDLEQSLSDQDVTTTSSSSPRRIGYALVGVACLVACGLAACVYAAPKSAGDRITVRQLLEGDDMIEVATQNAMSLWHLHPEKKEKVRAMVTKGLKHITSEYEKQGVFEARAKKTLSTKQKDAVLNVVAHMRDPRVHQVGRDVAKAVVGAHGREEAKQRIMKSFSAERLGELRQLHDEIFAGIRKAAKKDTPVSFHPEHMRMVQSFPEMLPELDVKSLQNRRLDVSQSSPGSMLNAADFDTAGDNGMTALEFLASFCDEARVILDNVDFLGDASGQDMKIPSEAKSFVGGVDFFAQLADCLNRAGGNEVKEGMCPMKYSSAAFDMISCLDNELGMANENGGLDAPSGSGGDSIFDDLMKVMGWSDSSTSSSAQSSSGVSSLFGSTAPAPAPAASKWNWN